MTHFVFFCFFFCQNYLKKKKSFRWIIHRLTLTVFFFFFSSVFCSCSAYLHRLPLLPVFSLVLGDWLFFFFKGGPSERKVRSPWQSHKKNAINLFIIIFFFILWDDPLDLFASIKQFGVVDIYNIPCDLHDNNVQSYLFPHRFYTRRHGRSCRVGCFIYLFVEKGIFYFLFKFKYLSLHPPRLWPNTVLREERDPLWKMFFFILHGFLKKCFYPWGRITIRTPVKKKERVFVVVDQINANMTYYDLSYENILFNVIVKFKAHDHNVNGTTRKPKTKILFWNLLCVIVFRDAETARRHYFRCHLFCFENGCWCK